MDRVERTGEGSGRFIAIPQRDIDDLACFPLDLKRRHRQPSPPHILREGNTRDIGEHPDEVERRAARDPGCDFHIHLIREIVLDIPDGLVQS